jgi:hypothetical protein
MPRLSRILRFPQDDMVSQDYLHPFIDQHSSGIVWPMEFKFFTMCGKHAVEHECVETLK